MEVNMGRHLGIDFSRILMDFGTEVGQENRAKRVMMMVMMKMMMMVIMIMIMIMMMMVAARFLTAGSWGEGFTSP